MAEEVKQFEGEGGHHHLAFEVKVVVPVDVQQYRGEECPLQSETIE